jgi:hypothetical protein
MDSCQINFKSVAHKATAFLNWNGKPTSSTIKEKNYEIENLCYKALEVIRCVKSEKTNKRADLIEQLIKSGIVSSSDLIQANEVLRWLEDNHEIFLVEDSGLVNVTTYRNISNFDRHQRQLQEQWRLLHTKELRPSCAIEEAREIAAAAIVREEEEQKQQNKKRRYHSHVPTKKQTEEEQQWGEVCFLK